MSVDDNAYGDLIKAQVGAVKPVVMMMTSTMARMITEGEDRGRGRGHTTVHVITATRLHECVTEY